MRNANMPPCCLHPSGDSDFVAAFELKLKKHNPHFRALPENVKRRLLESYVDRMRAAALPSVEAHIAYDLYERAKQMPGDLTWLLGMLRLLVIKPWPP